VYLFLGASCQNRLSAESRAKKIRDALFSCSHRYAQCFCYIGLASISLLLLLLPGESLSSSAARSLTSFSVEGAAGIFFFVVDGFALFPWPGCLVYESSYALASTLPPLSSSNATIASYLSFEAFQSLGRRHIFGGLCVAVGRATRRKSNLDENLI
jgi:hypothetical protein